MSRWDPIDDIIDVDEVYAEEVVLEEDSWELIRKKAAETGENPDDIAKIFIQRLKDSIAQVPEEVKEMQRLVGAYALGKIVSTEEEFPECNNITTRNTIDFELDNLFVSTPQEFSFLIHDVKKSA